MSMKTTKATRLSNQNKNKTNLVPNLDHETKKQEQKKNTCEIKIQQDVSVK